MCTPQRPVKADPNRSCGSSTGHQILENRNQTVPESLELQLQVWLQPVAVQSSCSFLQFMQLDFQTLVDTHWSEFKDAPWSDQSCTEVRPGWRSGYSLI